MSLGRLSQQKLGLWGRIKRVMLTDVGALVRGLKEGNLEELEQVLLEADFGNGTAEVTIGSTKTPIILSSECKDRNVTASVALGFRCAYGSNGGPEESVYFDDVGLN